MRRATPLFALLLVALLTPSASASFTPSFSHVYTYNGVFVENDDIRTFPLADPGGPLPLACYTRSLDHGGPAGTITITVQDEAGDVVFVDTIVGAGIVGPRTQPIGLLGGPGGLWTITVNAEGDMLGVQFTVDIGATSAGHC